MEVLKVIMISGKARHGKDYIAKLIKGRLQRECNKRVIILHFADILKSICKSFYGWDGTKTETQRQILIDVAKRYRDMNKDFFAEIVATIVRDKAKEYDVFIIPDTRYPNEIEVMKSHSDMDVVTLRIIRPNFDNGLSPSQKSHESECSLDDYSFDWVMFNYEKPYDIYTKIEIDDMITQLATN